MLLGWSTNKAVMILEGWAEFPLARVTGEAPGLESNEAEAYEYARDII